MRGFIRWRCALTTGSTWLALHRISLKSHGNSWGLSDLPRITSWLKSYPARYRTWGATCHQCVSAAGAADLVRPELLQYHSHRQPAAFYHSTSCSNGIISPGSCTILDEKLWERSPKLELKDMRKLQQLSSANSLCFDSVLGMPEFTKLQFPGNGGRWRKNNHGWEVRTYVWDFWEKKWRQLKSTGLIIVSATYVRFWKYEV